MTIYKASVLTVILAVLAIDVVADSPSTKAVMRQTFNALWSALQR